MQITIDGVFQVMPRAVHEAMSIAPCDEHVAQPASTPDRVAEEVERARNAKD